MAGENPQKIYLFTWENIYSLSKELNRRKTGFIEKNGPGSIFLFNRENRDSGQIKQTIFGWWFFITTKMVILYGIPLDTTKSNTMKIDEIESLMEDIMNFQVPSEVFLVCVSYTPDKRGRFYKRLDKLNKENPQQNLIKKFELLKDSELISFVRQESANLSLSSESIEALIRKVWNDQFRLVSEIEKLYYRKQSSWKEITPEVINDVCFWMLESDVFKLLDLVLTDSEAAVKFVQGLQNEWLDRNAVNWSFARGLRNYLLVLDYANRWITDVKQIASELKQNPWAIMNIVKKLSLLKEKKDLIETLFKWIVDIDYEIKNGNAQPESYFFTIKKILLQK